MTNTPTPDVIVTSALPYANGPIHIGHLVEYIQTDIYVRFRKLSGERVAYLCADDTHGTAIEINAAKEGVTPQEYVRRWHQAHQESFARYGISFDSYYSTDSEENRVLVEELFAKLQAGGYIYEREMEQLYSEQDGRFLPDRYVKGTCPRCGAPDQYGDSCEQCGATYKPTELVNPRSVLSGDTPVLKKTTHFFFKLSALSDWLRDWLASAKIQPEVRNQVLGWVEKGLEDWCISRDGPYFGFRIPGAVKNGIEKFFYVWLDAPVGYLSSLAHLLGGGAGGVDAAKAAWRDGEIIHFIGKDIIYFHLLFWPAVLHAAGWKVPDEVVVHGFLTVDGEKMSKSRGTFLTADEFASLLPDTEFLRFYYAASLGHAMTDLDLNLDDFTARINKELVGNVANFIYRTLSFAKKHYDTLPARASDDAAQRLEQDVRALEDEARQHYAAKEFRKAIQAVLRIADLGNSYFQAAEPWKRKEESGPVLATCANLVKDLAILLAPVTPRFAAAVLGQLGLDDSALSFSRLGFTLPDSHTLGEPAILWRPIEKPKIGAAEKGVVEKGVAEKGASSAKPPTKDEETKQAAKSSAREAGKISPGDLRLVVAEITKVERHPKADKLYIEHLDDGSGKERVIVSGLVPYYNAEELLGKRIVLVDNLKPAKLRGVLSQGMLLAAESEDGTVEVLEVDAPPGTPVLIEGFKQGEEEITIDEFFSVKIIVDEHHVRCDGRPLTANNQVLTTRKVVNGTVG